MIYAHAALFEQTGYTVDDSSCSRCGTLVRHPARDRSAHRRAVFTTRATGAGIGLALVKRIVEMHHGEVRATSAANGGACFTVSLPITQATD
jgi:sensor histidine kinase regulating citrate/malate metabolism